MVDLEDGFSFPAATGSSLPSFIDSPPLWRASSAPTSLSRHREEGDKAARMLEEEGLRRSRDQECPRKGPGGSSNSSSGEERMDMLWEDFNEELVSPLGLQRTGRSSSEKEMTGFGCVKGLSISKANGEKPGVVGLLKVLRKLFLIHNHNNHRPLKKRQGQPHIRW